MSKYLNYEESSSRKPSWFRTFLIDAAIHVGLILAVVVILYMVAVNRGVI